LKTLKRRNLTSLAIIALLLVSAFVAVSAIRPAKAINTEWTAYMHVSAAPNPVGVNQPTLVTWTLDKVNPLATIRSNQWEGIIVTITGPDNVVERKGPLTAWATGGAVFSYVPKKTGLYTIKADFPGQWVNGSYTSISTAYGNWANGTGTRYYENRWYKPCSGTEILNVTDQQVPGIANAPLPTSFWTAPVTADNKGWYEFMNNWLMPGYDRTGGTFVAFGTAYVPYGSAPDSPHILWKQPVQTGGVVGGAFGDKTFYTGLTYETLYTPYILNGRIIYNDHGLSSTATFGTRCIDLYTGEEIWYLNATNIAFCQTLDVETGNEHGVLGYMWSISGSTWTMYDAFSARLVCTVTNMASGGTYAQGPNGEILYYVLNVAQKSLVMWNSSRAIYGHIYDTWSPTLGGTYNASRSAGTTETALTHSPFIGVEWNVTIPQLWNGTSIQLLDEGYLLAATNTQMNWPPTYCQAAFDVILDRDSAGAYPDSISALWMTNRTNMETHRPSYSKNIGGGVFAFWDEGACSLHAYDIKSGAELWISDPITTGWGHFNSGLHIAYGKVYMGDYDGTFRAYDVATGDLAFSFYCGNAGYLTPYGSFPVNSFTIVDHKIFLTNDEHSPDSILWTGAKLWCIDADTGASLWNYSSRLRQATPSNGILTCFNLYDNCIYTFGKGASKTTVAAPLVQVPLGNGVTLTGTVTDQTPSIKDTAAISDESMDAWMQYMFLQKPRPADAKGVKVTLTATDSNGNPEPIGEATTDSNGNYGLMWTPKMQGQYKITASFEGTNSYWSSDATTYLGVSAASATPTTAPPTATPTPTETATPTATVTAGPEPKAGPDTAIYVAIAAAVIIAVIAVAAIILRRRK
jgi:hypothetical protein